MRAAAPVVGRWRIAGAVVILTVLAVLGAWMIPPYLDNFRFQQYLKAAARDPEAAGRPVELVRIGVAERAARMGLPVRMGDVRVSRGADGLRIEVPYVVRLDMPLYTVDLHFRPSAGGR
ncbi:MAG: hypothetical protein ACK5AZ_14380 [Bryobacteraceae bacterium]